MASQKNEVIIDVTIDNSQAKKDAAALTATLAQQRAELAKHRKALKDSGGASKESAKKVAEFDRAVKETSKNLRIAQNEAQAEASSINALRASVNKLTKERNNLNTADAEGLKRFNELTVSIKNQTDQLKKLEGAVGDNRRNVGNYRESVMEAMKANQIFANGLGAITEGMNVLKLATRSFGLTLLALPFVAIVAAITVFLTKTREGRKILERFGAVAKALFSGLTQAIAKIGKGIVEFFNDPLENGKQLIEDLGEAIKENLMNRLTAFIKIAKGVAGVFVALFEGDMTKAMEEAGEAGKGMFQVFTGVEADVAIEQVGALADEIARIAEETDKATLAAQRNRDAIRALTIEASKQTRIAEENRKLRDDESKSEAERLRFNDLALVAEKKRRDALLQRSRLQESLLRREIDLAGGLANAQDEQLDELAQFQADRFDILEDYATRSTELLVNNNSIRREALTAFAEFESLLLAERLIKEKVIGDELLKIQLLILSKQKEAALVGLSEQSNEFKKITQQFRNEELQLRADFLNEVLIQETDAKALELANFNDTEKSKTQIMLDEEVKRQANAEDAARNRAMLIQKEMELEQIKFDSLKGISAGLVELTDQETAAGKAAFLFDKVLAIADVIIKTQQANAVISAQLGVLAPPAIALNTLRGAVSVGTIAATSIQGFASGGYTGDGARYEPAGIVHKGEFVVSKPQVQRLGGARAVSNMTGQPMGGFANGGMVGAGMVSRARTAGAIGGLANDIKQLQIQVAVTDIEKATRKYNQIQTKVNA